MASVRDFLPVFNKPIYPEAKVAKPVDTGGPKAVAKLFKVSSLALGFTSFGTHSRTNFESSPYEFTQIIKAIDTDSLVKQAFNKYKELLWKEGWDITSESSDAVQYLNERIDFMEYSMKRPFSDFLVEVGDQLVKFHNAFIVKARGDLRPFFPGKLTTTDKDPIVGYYIIPAETVEILRDRHNKPIAYRQNLDQLSGWSRTRQPRWSADDVIHLYIDKKPGRAFGTPFTVSVLDDVIALRQMEEDIQNLVHRELFPLYKYRVGDEENPADPTEIDRAANELANLRVEGGIILPGDRYDVDVIGAQETALDASKYLDYFLVRVCSGLGLSPHHFGIMNSGANRSVTDRLDIALYDKVKNYQKYIAEQIRLQIFTELLLEGGFDPIAHPSASGESERCYFKFREIDVDSQVKKESHILEMWNNQMLSWPEARLALNLDPEDFDEDMLQASIVKRIEAENAIKIEQSKPKPAGATTSRSSSSSSSSTRKSTANKVRPRNQHGRRTSPNIRHMQEVDHDWLDEVVELFGEE